MLTPEHRALEQGLPIRRLSMVISLERALTGRDTALVGHRHCRTCTGGFTFLVLAVYVRSILSRSQSGRDVTSKPYSKVLISPLTSASNRRSDLVPKLHLRVVARFVAMSLHTHCVTTPQDSIAPRRSNILSCPVLS